MNEQLQTALADLLGKANSGIDAGATFLQAQLPDVIQQLLAWKMAHASLYFAAHVLAAAIGVFALRWAIPVISGHARASRLYYGSPNGSAEEKEGKRTMRELDGKMPVAFIACVYAAFSIICFLGFGSGRLSTMIQIWLAPKIYLIEYAASLAK